MKRDKDAAYWFFIGIETGLAIAAFALIVDLLIDSF